MAVAHGIRTNKVAWVDLATSDAAGAREFYAKLFGWKSEVNPDPQYGGYALAKLEDGGEDVAGIGPTQSPEQPTAWSVYIGTDDADALGEKVKAAGGTVVAPAFDVGPLGRMAVFQDPSGAFISAWQSSGMGSFRTHDAGTFTWAELTARGVDKAIPFYEEVFGWTAKTSPMAEGQPPYTEFHLGEHDIAGAQEMNEAAPAEMPSYWMVYFHVHDVDDSHTRALEAGGHEMLPPADFPGGRFAIVSDPQGAMFGIMKMG